MNEVITTLVGNLTDNPEIRITPSGVPVCKMRLAQTPRTFDKNRNEWKDGEPFFINLTAWRDLAENVVESLHKGDRVIAQVRLSQRTYDHRDGYKVTVTEAEVDEIGPSLRYAEAKPQRRARGESGGQQQAQAKPAQAAQQQRPAPQSAPADDPWA